MKCKTYIIILFISLSLIFAFSNLSNAYDNKEVHPYICRQAFELIKSEPDSDMVKEIGLYIPDYLSYDFWKYDMITDFIISDLSTGRHKYATR